MSSRSQTGPLFADTGLHTPHPTQHPITNNHTMHNCSFAPSKRRLHVSPPSTIWFSTSQRINKFAPTADKPFVLGLPTGSSPLTTYKALVRMHKAGELSFKHVVTFNMDE